VFAITECAKSRGFASMTKVTTALRISQCPLVGDISSNPDGRVAIYRILAISLIRVGISSKTKQHTSRDPSSHAMAAATACTDTDGKHTLARFDQSSEITIWLWRHLWHRTKLVTSNKVTALQPLSDRLFALSSNPALMHLAQHPTR
jgi:hypothetical protein